MNDITFRGRIKVCCLTFANEIFKEPTTTTAHNTKYKWAQRCYQSSEMVAQEAQPPVVMHPSVQAAGSAVADTDLQAAVEAVLSDLI
jgi:hypothetical protein